MKNKVVLRPHEVTCVEVVSDRPMSVNANHVFLSHHDDDDEGPFYIPSITVSGGPMKLWVENTSEERRAVKRGTPLGVIKRCGDIAGDETVMAFSAEEMSEAMEEEKTCADINKTVGDGPECENNAPGSSEKPEKSEESEEPEMPVKLSEIVGTGKVTSDTLSRCLEKGIEVDLELGAPAPDMEMENEEIEIQKEKEKSEKCPFWPNKNEFMQNFDLSAVDDQTAERTRQFLWEFRHVFFNQKFPEQFRKGIDAPPIKMTTKPNLPPPPAEKLRRMSETKLAYLKKHIEELKAQGVIEEMKDATGCHLSPVHIVVEKRYIASEKRNVLKSRLVLDGRVVNECMEDVSFPLPFCDEFRRTVAAEGYTVFTNMDAALFYYQFRVDHKTAKKWFGFSALGKVYLLTRLAQGNKN